VATILPIKSEAPVTAKEPPTFTKVPTFIPVVMNASPRDFIVVVPIICGA
jgi:hypothetical protein